MSSKTASIDPMEALTDIQGTVTVLRIPAFDQNDLAVTDHVHVLIQHGEDNSHTVKQVTVEEPHAAAARPRNRMKFKDCCMRGNKSKEHIHLYSDNVI